MSVSSRLKRYNLFPHLVAQDLAFGVEYTPINTLTINDNAVGVSALRQDAAAAALRGDNEGAATINRVAAASSESKPISFNTATVKPVEDPNLGAVSKSELSIIKFPENLGQGTPYILFKIFETQTGAIDDSRITDPTSASLRSGFGVIDSAIAGIPGGSTAAGAAAGAAAFGGIGGAIFGAAISTDAGQGEIDRVGTAIFGENAGSITSRAKDLLRGFALKRNTEQLAIALALFMPDGLTTNYDNEYEALSVTATLGATGFAAQALSSRDGAAETINPFIMEGAFALAAKIIGNEDVKKLGLFATTGFVNNPQLEMIYTSPVLRTFTFDFRLIPRNAREAATIQGIIKQLKYYSAPEIPQGTSGRYMIPPAQFEIEFYNGNDTENLFLFKTKKCVLKGLSLDYSPNGFATFADGAPVETRMQLTFQETTIIDKQSVLAGY